MKLAAHTPRHTGAILSSAFFVLAGLAVIVALILAWYSLDPVQQQRRAERARLEIAAAQLDQQARAAALARQQHIDQAIGWIDYLTGAFYKLLPALIVGGVGYVLIDRYRLSRRVVWADARGVLPVPRQTIEHDPSPALATLAALHTTQLAAAQRPVLPEHLTYAPKISTERAAVALATEPTEPSAAAMPANVPTFRDLLQRGVIAQGEQLVLGVAAGELLRGDWTKLYTCAVAGLGGTGKSTTVRFAACQAVLHGAKFVVLDRHMDGGEDESLAQTLAPLHRHMLCSPAADDQAVLQAIRLVKAIGDARKNGHDKDRTPILLCVDEFTSYMRRSTIAAELSVLLEEIAQELRKFKVFAMIAGHVWTVKATGGSELRSSLASAYVHRINPNQARYLLGMGKEELPDLLHLPQGSAYLYTTTGELQMVQIPNTTADDVQYVAALLDTPSGLPAAYTPSLPGATGMPEIMPAISLEHATPSAAYSPLESAATPTAEALHAARMFMDGKTIADIVLELRDVRSNQGGKYQQASAEIHELIRQGLPAVLTVPA